MKRLFFSSVLTAAMIASTAPAVYAEITVTLSTPGTPDLNNVRVGDTIHVRVDAVVDDPPKDQWIEEILIAPGHDGLLNTGWVLDPLFVAGGHSELSGPYTEPFRVATWADVYWDAGVKTTGHTGRVMEFDLLATHVGMFSLGIGPEESGYRLSFPDGNIFISNPFSIPVTVVPEPLAILSAAIGFGAVGLLGRWRTAAGKPQRRFL